MRPSSWKLFDPDGAVLEDGLPVLRTTGVVRDDDGAGSNLSIFVSDPVITEGDAGQKLAVFEVLLSRPAPSGFTVNYQTSDLTATAGSDYQAMVGTIDFVTGQTVATVAVPVFGDLDAEAAEKFALEVTVPGVPAIDAAGSVGEGNDPRHRHVPCCRKFRFPDQQPTSTSSTTCGSR